MPPGQNGRRRHRGDPSRRVRAGGAGGLPPRFWMDRSTHGSARSRAAQAWTPPSAAVSMEPHGQEARFSSWEETSQDRVTIWAPGCPALPAPELREGGLPPPLHAPPVLFKVTCRVCTTQTSVSHLSPPQIPPPRPRARLSVHHATCSVSGCPAGSKRKEGRGGTASSEEGSLGIPGRCALMRVRDAGGPELCYRRRGPRRLEGRALVRGPDWEKGWWRRDRPQQLQTVPAATLASLGLLTDAPPIPSPAEF